MILKDMFKKTNRENHGLRKESRPEVPDGLLRKCNKCGTKIGRASCRERV